MGDKTPVSTLKGYTGHTLGSCGAFEVWASINALAENWVPATVNLVELDKRCAGLNYIVGDIQSLKTRMAMSNNFAFGGVNTSLILKVE